MTKASDFIMNTDFLALAQTGTAEFTAVFPAETMPAGQSFSRTRDFTLKSVNGAIDRILISRNNGNFTVGASLTILTTPALSVFVYRPNASTLRIRLYGYASSAYSMPAQTIKVKISSFRPPNVFQCFIIANTIANIAKIAPVQMQAILTILPVFFSFSAS